MRVFMNYVAVFERAWLRFIRVADQIDRLLFIGFDKTPLHSARKSGAATTAETGCFDFVDDLFPRHRNGLSQLFVTAVAQVSVDVDLPIVASDVLENQSMLKRMRRFRISDFGFRIRGNVCHEFRRNSFVQFVIHHADRRGAAAGETFDKFNAVISISAYRNRIMHSIALVLALNSSRRTEIFHQLVAPGHGATECTANTNMRFARALPAEHWVKRD